jgi:dienelactone hydrolase
VRRVLAALALVAWPLAALGGHGDVPVVTQSVTFASATLSDADLLAGTAGTPVSVGGQLRLPVAPARIPAVVLVHGETGIAANVRHWADTLSSIGLAVLVLDSFSARGITETSTDMARLSDASMLVDAYRALGTLATHPKIDGRRIAVMGFSKGGWAALYGGTRRFQRAYGSPGSEFAGHVAFYPPCGTTFRDDEQVSGRPIRIVHGTADDWMPIEPCRQYVARLRQAGADAAMIELAGARHFFDDPNLSALVRLPGVQRPACLADERAGLGLVNRATGRPITRADCVRSGATIGHDAAAYEEAVRRVKEALVAALGGSRSCWSWRTCTRCTAGATCCTA